MPRLPGVGSDPLAGSTGGWAAEEARPSHEGCAHLFDASAAARRRVVWTRHHSRGGLEALEEIWPDGSSWTAWARDTWPHPAAGGSGPRPVSSRFTSCPSAGLSLVEPLEEAGVSVSASISSPVSRSIATAGCSSTWTSSSPSIRT